MDSWIAANRRHRSKRSSAALPETGGAMGSGNVYNLSADANDLEMSGISGEYIATRRLAPPLFMFVLGNRGCTSIRP